MWKTGSGITVFFALYKSGIAGLLQSDIVASDVLIRILEDFPVLGIILVVVYWAQKTSREDAVSRHKQYIDDAEKNRVWLKNMLDNQKSMLSEVYKGNQVFITALIQQIKAEQSQTNMQIKELSQQMGVNTATVNEIAQVDHIFHELIEKLEKK